MGGACICSCILRYLFQDLSFTCSVFGGEVGAPQRFKKPWWWVFLVDCIRSCTTCNTVRTFWTSLEVRSGTMCNTVRASWTLLDRISHRLTRLLRATSPLWRHTQRSLLPRPQTDTGPQGRNQIGSLNLQAWARIVGFQSRPQTLTKISSCPLASWYGPG